MNKKINAKCNLSLNSYGGTKIYINLNEKNKWLTSQEPEVGVVLFPVGAVVGAMVGFIVVGGAAVGGFIII